MSSVTAKLKTLILIFISITLFPILSFAQTISIVAVSSFTVAGNGHNGGPTNGEIAHVWLSNPPWTDFPADSSGNTLIIHSPVSNHIFGGVNYPFTSTPVSSGTKNVTLKNSINADYNSIFIYSDLPNADARNVYGAFSVLGDALTNVVPVDGIVNSPISLSNNSVQIDSSTTIWELYGACLNLNAPPFESSSTVIIINSSLSLDNNQIILNSPCTVAHIRDAYLAPREGHSSEYNIPYISLSSNSISINTSEVGELDKLYNQISVAYLDFYSVNEDDVHAHVDNLYITNNKISFSAAASGLQLPNTAVYGVRIDNPEKVNVTNKYVQNNMIEFNSAKNVTLQSISGFDLLSFILPLNIFNNETLLTLTHQHQDIQVDAHKVSVSNYDHHTSTLTVNLIDASGYGRIDLLNTNGSYLYDHTRTQLQVKKDKKLLMFIFDPSIAASPYDPIDPAPPGSPITSNLDPQTTVLSGAASSNLAFLSQGLDLIIDKAIDSAKYLSVKSHSWAPFACVDAAKSKFFIGHNSDLDINGFSILAGMAKNLPIHDHNFTFAAFFEHGNSKFETSHHFDYDEDDFTVGGNGHAYYNGAGLLARFDLNNNIYFNASARAGLASCNFKTVDLTKISHLSFDYSPTYYGANAGAGYLYPVNKDFNLNFNANYFITNLTGEKTPLPENQSISFDTEHLQKIKIGLKFIRLLSDPSGHPAAAFIGPAFEYQLHNDFNATIENQPVDSPKFGGGNANIEAGFNTFIGDLNINLSASYSNGKNKESVDGLLKFLWAIGGNTDKRAEEKKVEKAKEKGYELKKVVYHAFGEFELSQEAKNTLNENVQYLINNPGVKVVLEGHADERGTRKYNEGLGYKRAEKVKEYYESKGIEGSRMKVESYGEDMLADTTSTEEAHSKNRRVVTRVVGTK
ncbi:MAG: OmpA family protein [Endomicrobium sp.]|jgi:peptidoglycan-associated lipoprotein|nr:OmpA family protein [Endomicrobium sp.]